MCPNCWERYPQSWLYLVKSTRSITAEAFDVFDLNRPILNRQYERICRVCGTHLQTKNGAYAAQRRHCKLHAGDYNYMLKYSWNVARLNAIQLNRLRHMVELTLMNWETLIKYYDTTKIKCEQCGQYISSNYCEVHHVVPVHTLTIANLDLIWDQSNLHCLCRPCHKLQDHQLKKAPSKINQKKAKYKSFLSIDTFLK